jgi:hypothetical protein
MVALAEPAGVQNLHRHNALRYMRVRSERRPAPVYLDGDGMADTGHGWVEPPTQGIVFSGRSTSTEYRPIPLHVAVAWSEAR